MTSIIETQPSSSSALKQLLVRRPLVSFFFMAFVFSWIALIPYILSQWTILPNTKNYAIFFILNPFIGPAFASYIMHRTLGGKEAWKNVRKGIRQFKAGLKWYLFILAGIPAVMFLGMIVLNGGSIPNFQDMDPSFFVGYVIQFVLIFFGGGPLGEELGWRGFALPRMQARFGALKASLLLGLLWTFWHLPHFLTETQRGGPGTSLSTFFTNFPIFLVTCFAITIIMTWVFNHTRGNLFIAILLHTSINAFSLIQAIVSEPNLTDTDLPFLFGFGILALLILVFTRGRLGYTEAASNMTSVKNSVISK